MRSLIQKLASWYLGKQASKCRGFFTFSCRNRDGSLAWSKKIALNGATTAGLNDMLNAYFGAASQKTTWFIGLIDNAGFTALSPNDTMASHSGWSENSNYTAVSRPQWTPGSASGGSITNPSAVVFTMNASVTIKGAFLASDSGKGGTGGLLWSTGTFSVNESLTNTQTLSVSYTAPLTAQ